MKNFTYIKLMVASAAIAVSAVSNAQVLFDSAGFESYTTGSLTGQNGFINEVATGAPFSIGATVGVGGTKGVQVASNGVTNWTYPALNYTPTAAQNIVRIDASIARTLGATISSFGYSIDVYPIVGGRTTRFGLVNNGGVIQPFVTARFNTTTQLFDPTAAAASVLVGGAVAQSTFVDFSAFLNYTSKTMDLLVNGVSVTGGSTIPFADLTATTLGDADFQISTGAGATDSGFLDNYKVTAVPEPASMVAMGLGIAGLAAKRRRKNS
jgi:hypothetical protein